ncbi:universal stress protein [Hydrogenophaga sp. 5NK40-0174]|uniref:universal stress protein n=1 Tax=Hydrogenophaga sp. 5NK40-0174 TaxID=3127649 RepID=UPI003107B287
MVENNNDELKVLACVDQSDHAQAVADGAAWVCARLKAPLEFLHVIERHQPLGPGQDHSGTLGVNAQESLMARIAEEEGERSKLEREHGREFLARLREYTTTTHGLDQVDVRQRHDDLEASVTDLQPGVQMVVLGRRGRSAQAGKHGGMGSHFEWVVRAVEKNVLAVHDRFVVPQRAVIAFDDSSRMRKAVEWLAQGELLKGLPVEIILSGKPDAKSHLQVDWAVKVFADAGYEASGEVRPGDPEDVVIKALSPEGNDLLVMGAYSHSPLRSWLFGSKTSGLLKAAPVSALLMR